MSESLSNYSESHRMRCSNFAKNEVAKGYCRACGNRVVGRGKRGFCSDACRFWSKVQKGPTCWLWTGARHCEGAGKKGKRNLYGVVYYKGRPRRAHIVSWALSVGTLPDVSIGGNAICHHCDTPLCVRPSHLFKGTAKENMQDAARKGRLHIARPGRQKVTPEQIEVIRARVGAGETHKAVAVDFGIARNTVSDIMSGKRRQYDAPLIPAVVERAS